MRERRRTTRGGFSLLEVVIVVAIIAILAAIGIPRMSRGSRGANDSALSGNLAVLRNAIDLYAAEHGGSYPAVTTASAQLSQYTNITGGTSATKTTTYVYGPYIRSIPPLPVGDLKGKSGIKAVSDANTGWIYNSTSGTIAANCADDEKDDAGVQYNKY